MWVRFLLYLNKKGYPDPGPPGPAYGRPEGPGLLKVSKYII